MLQPNNTCFCCSFYHIPSTSLQVKHGLLHKTLTLSLSMASSLPGANMMRSCRLLTEAARLDKAESEEDGLIPTKALVTVERLSFRWLISATLRLSLLFSKSDMSMGFKGGKEKGKKQDKKKEGKDRKKNCSWEIATWCNEEKDRNSTQRYADSNVAGRDRAGTSY